MRVLIATLLIALSTVAMADARLILKGVGHFPWDSGNTNNEFKRSVDVNIVQSNGGDTASGHASFEKKLDDTSFLPDVFQGDRHVTTIVTSETTGQQCVMTTDNDTYRSDDWDVTVERRDYKLIGVTVCRDGAKDE